MGTVNPLVTIAIPTFNRAGSYLKEAVLCALGQTYPDIEIIVSDNCSADDTEAVMKGFADPRIRYVRHSENIGANNNFRFCLEQARGTYFLLFQDDDRIDSDFVETCMKRVSTDGAAGIIRTGTRLIDAAGSTVHEKPNRAGGLSLEEFFLAWFRGKTSLYLCSTLFHTAMLREAGGFQSRHNLFQDVAAEVKLAARGGRIDIEDIKAGFRRHGSEMTFAARVGQWCEDSLDLLDLMCSVVPPEHRVMIKDEGARFFARINYNRASAVKPPLMRYRSYVDVWNYFDRRHLPGMNHILSPVLSLLKTMPFYDGLKAAHKKLRPFSAA